MIRAVTLFLLVCLCIYQDSSASQADLTKKTGVHIISYHDLFYLSAEELDELEMEINNQLTQASVAVEAWYNKITISLFNKKYEAAANILSRVQKYSDGYYLKYLSSTLYAALNKPELCTLSFYEMLSDCPAEFIEKELAEIFECCMTVEEFEKYNTATKKNTYTKKYLLQNDPTPVSPENEYLVEMINRSDYAFRELKSFDKIDDRGIVHIKYGAPDVRKEFKHTGHETECWIYNNICGIPAYFDFYSNSKTSFQFKLVESMNQLKRYGSKACGNANAVWFPVALGERELVNPDTDQIDGGLSKYFYEDRMYLNAYYFKIAKGLMDNELFKLQPDSPMPVKTTFQILKETDQYIDIQAEELPFSETKIKKRIVPLVVDFARFKEKNGTVKTEFYYAFEPAHFDTIANGFFDVDLITELAMKDTNYNIVDYSIDTSLVNINFGNEICLNSVNYRSLPGESIFALEIKDKDDSSVALFQNRVSLSEFESDNLLLSDIKFTQGMVNMASGSKNSNPVTKPYPFNEIKKDENIFIYYEIYNLIEKSGVSNFDVTMSFVNIEEKGFFEKLLGSEKKIPSITNNYKGNETEDYIFLKLDMENLDTGSYQLIVKVKDNNSGLSFTRKKNFILN